jgi:hypothetical protein
MFAGGAARPSLENAPCSTYPPSGVDLVLGFAVVDAEVVVFVAFLLETVDPALLEKARTMLSKSKYELDACGVQLRWIAGAPAFTTLLVDDPEGDEALPSLFGEGFGASIAKALRVRVWEFEVSGQHEVSTVAWSNDGTQRWDADDMKRAAKETGARYEHLFVNGHLGAVAVALVGQSWKSALEALQRRRDVVIADAPPTTDAALAALRVKVTPGWEFFVDPDGHIAKVRTTYDRAEAARAAPTIVAKAGIRFERGYDYFVDADGRVQRRQTVWGFLEEEAAKKKAKKAAKKATATTKKPATRKTPAKKTPTKKTAAKKTPTKKTAAKKPPAKSTAKTAAKKKTAKKAAKKAR